MTTKTQFPDFDRYVCEGDTVTVEIDGFTLTATIYRDDDGSAPDERQDGFWPSLDENDAGYIGPSPKARWHATRRALRRSCKHGGMMSGFTAESRSRWNVRASS